MGLDPATTTNKKSNPSSIAVIQQVGLMFYVRLLLRFKTSDPRVTSWLMREVVTLPHGLRARSVGALATNERFYCATLKRELAGICPVELVIESEATMYLGQKMSVKAYLGNLVVNTIEDGYLAVPDYPWVQADLRQPVRTGGTFSAEVDEVGNHADGFCSISAALHALIGAGGARAEATAVPTAPMAKGSGAASWLKNPYAGSHINQRNLNV